MKLNKLSISIFLLFVTVFASCKKDDDVTPASPGITLHEIGSNNSKIGYIGSDLHIDAEIVAPGNIANVKLEVHKQTGTGWVVDQDFTEGLAGLKNATFHKHIDIPADAAAGMYHLHLVVTDQNGQTTEAESELELKEDITLPAISGFEVAANTAGTDLHVEAAITAVNKIAKVTVEVHGTAWEKEFEFTDAAMVGQTAFTFHKHMDISAAPAGHYHVHMNIVDQAGKEREFEEHFDK